MNLGQNWSRTKEVLGAYFRQGLNELGAAFYGGGTAAQPSQYGMIGTKTPGEVADGLRGIRQDSHRQDERPAPVLDEQLRQANERVPERDAERAEPHLERD